MIEPVEPQVWNRAERSHVLRDTDSMSQEELRLEVWRLRDELAGAEASLAGLRAQLEGRQREFLASLEMSGVANDDHLKKERDLYRSVVTSRRTTSTGDPTVLLESVHAPSQARQRQQQLLGDRRRTR